MVLLPEERGMTLSELRQIAARQQHQIETQQQLLVAKEQRLKFLKQQEARHHNLSERQLDTSCLLNLRDKIESQEIKLRQLRALRGQVDQQKTNNSNLGTELDSIRALFCEKEKELDLAVSKVEELTRQLDEIKKNSRKSFLLSTSELENLRRELLYRSKLSEQQNNYICQQREKINNRQQDIAVLDKKINELNKRLNRKRILNEQFASQFHLASLSHSSNDSNGNSGMIVKVESRGQEILERDHTQDDLAASLHAHHKCDFGEFSLTKNDPKYQTLPYNTKFTLKEKHLEDSLSSSTEDESWSSKSETSCDQKSTKPFSNMCNFSPRPFNSFNANSGVQKVTSQINDEDIAFPTKDTEAVSNENLCSDNSLENEEICSVNNIQKQESPRPDLNKPNFQAPYPKMKPAVPPKPALCVKPMLMNQENNSRHLPIKKDPPEPDTVSMALTFLKNKSSEKEKSDFRHSNSRDSSQDPLLPRSRILTYFSKTLLQPEGISHENEKSDVSEIPKRKPTFVQLPIKPKPLTIRKNPSIEPPKLKAQSAASSASHRKFVESQPISFSLKSSKSFSQSETDENSVEMMPKTSSNIEETSIEVLPCKIEDIKNQNNTEIEAISDTNESCQRSADVKKDDNETTCDETDYLSDQSEIESQLNSTLQQIKKGNLKGEGSIRASRRVSFDPLALLLDAALEGELELVRKIASEVVNPSAANDEGITALHNAICAGQFEVVKFLVEFGCDVNAPDSDGWTPLHCAASCNNLAMVKFLVERGACIFATTLSDQETAAEKCEEDGAGFDGCSEYLFSLQENLGVMNNGIVYAVYDYDVQNADELSFRNGDMLTVLRRTDDEENEWWWCRLHDQEGYVPRNLLGLYPRVNSPVEKPS